VLEPHASKSLQINVFHQLLQIVRTKMNDDARVKKWNWRPT